VGAEEFVFDIVLLLPARTTEDSVTIDLLVAMELEEETPLCRMGRTADDDVGAS
jgi:hypothetical protein